MFNLIIGDDDPTSRKVLGDFIKDLPNFNIIGEATNGEDLIQLIVTLNPDVVLVDIDIPKLNGLEAVKNCRELQPNLKVIFITSNENYAVEAFNINATDYILKPIERERLFSALYKVSNESENQDIRQKKELTVKEQNSLTFIPLEDIYFIEKAERKTKIHTKLGTLETNESLLEYEKVLDLRFSLSHRSNIINLDQIYKIEMNGQMYVAYFHDYNKTAKISKHKINKVQEFKGNYKIKEL